MLMITNKEKYIDFCNHNDIPLFIEPWWLDVVCGEDNWNVIIAEQGGNIFAVFPYFISKERLINIKNPFLTPRLGPYIKYPDNQLSHRKRSFEKKVINQIIEQLPKYDYLNVNLEYNFDNLLPFYWNDFTLKVSYSYLLEDIKNIDKKFNGFASNIRRKIKQAEKKLQLKTSDDVQVIWDLVSLTFKRQNKKPPYSFALLKDLDKELKNNNRRSIYFAEDENGNVHSAIYIVFDSKRAYYLIGGSDPDYKKSGASSFLLWNAIKDASKRVDCFDFEGSMIEPIERYFSEFGAIQKPYYGITKIGNKKTRTLLYLKSILTKKNF